jgi:hypothetical protein
MSVVGCRSPLDLNCANPSLPSSQHTPHPMMVAIPKHPPASPAQQYLMKKCKIEPVLNNMNSAHPPGHGWIPINRVLTPKWTHFDTHL